MPELPEVETVCRGLAPALEGQVLATAEIRRAGLRQAFPERFADRLTGRRVLRVWRRGKYYVWSLDDGMCVLGHLGMSGSWTITPAGSPVPEAGKHDHVRLQTDSGHVLTYRDPRRFGVMTLVSGNALAEHPLLAAMGPEPLSEDFDSGVLDRAFARRATPVKVALLDQSVVAGIGNIYASEALYRSGIDPRRPAAEITAPETRTLTAAVKTVLQEAIDSGGSSLRDHLQVTGELGYFQHRFAVYDRAGSACPDCTCDVTETGGIQRLVQGGRSTFYCPRRQG